MRPLVIVVVVLLLSACVSYPKIPVRLSLQSSSLINLTNTNAALPVRVIVYELRSIEAFNQASFEELWKHDKQVLSHDLLLKQSLILAPNEKKQLRLKRKKSGRYLGVVVLFRQGEHARWRASLPMPTQVNSFFNTIKIDIISNAVRFNV